MNCKFGAEWGDSTSKTVGQVSTTVHRRCLCAGMKKVSNVESMTTKTCKLLSQENDDRYCITLIINEPASLMHTLLWRPQLAKRCLAQTKSSLFLCSSLDFAFGNNNESEPKRLYSTLGPWSWLDPCKCEHDHCSNSQRRYGLPARGSSSLYRSVSTLLGKPLSCTNAI